MADKWNDYVAALRGEVKQQPLDDSTMVSRKKKGNKNRLRRKFARAVRFGASSQKIPPLPDSLVSQQAKDSNSQPLQTL